MIWVASVLAGILISIPVWLPFPDREEIRFSAAFTAVSVSVVVVFELIVAATS